MNIYLYFKSTDPVRRYIESQFDDTNNLSQSINNPLIAKLPDPLYVLYSLVLAYQQCDGMLEKSNDVVKFLWKRGTNN